MSHSLRLNPRSIKIFMGIQKKNNWESFLRQQRRREKKNANRKKEKRREKRRREKKRKEERKWNGIEQNRGGL